MGEAKKRRSCPAVGREIASAECGENRLSRYACPESCPFNPFAPANYSALLATEDRLDLMSVKRLAGEDPAGSAAILDAQRTHAAHGMHAATVWRLFFKRDAGDRTLAGRWEAAGFPGLANDERVFMRGKMRTHVVLLEVRRIFDAERFEAVDLLDAAGAPMVFVDRSMAGRAVRFTTLLTWAYPLPHFWRMSGTGIMMSDLGPFAPLEMLEACLAHLGGPAEREGQRRWLAENFPKIDAALAATGLERRRQMLAAMDACWTAATYELCVPGHKARAVLDAEADVDDEPLSPEERMQGFQRAVVWLDRRPPPVSAVAATQTILGRVLLGAKEWRIEAMGAARFERLRVAFEARMGDRVKFSRQRRDDLAGKLAAEEPPPDLALVPPRLLENPSSFDLSSSRVAGPPPGDSIADYESAMLAEHRRAWIDGPLPMLNGRTPREAADDPGLRARLIEIVKGQVRQVDQRNLASGRADDINTFIRELGLAEIDLPPPPSRPRPAAGRDEPADDLEDDFPAPIRAPAANRPAAPRLSGPPLDSSEAGHRVERVLDKFDRASDALDELADSGATLIDDTAALTDGMLTDAEFSFLVTFLFQAWFALVPLGVRAPALDFDAMAADFDRVLERFRQGPKLAAAAYADLPKRSRQPALLDAIATGVAVGIERAPKAMRPAPEKLPILILALHVLIDELDQALRRG
jgi:hypothetical protein